MVSANSIYQHIDYFGLSISPNAVRAVTSDRTGKIIKKSDIVSQKPFIIGDKIDQSSLISALKNVIQQSGINTPYATVCFPEKLAYSREHTLPKLPLSEISEAISWQITSIFPFKPDEVYYDWKLVNQTDTETKIVVTAVNIQLLDGIIAACEAAGIKPISFESSASALARAIKPLPPVAVITEIDPLGTSTTLIENGVSSITSTTSFSASADGQSVIQNIVSSIKQILSRMNDQTAVPNIIITGEKSSPKLAELLSVQLGQKVEELVIPDVPAIYHLAHVESQMTVELPESEKTINLLPASLQTLYSQEAELNHAKRTMRLNSIVSGIACISALFVFVVISGISSQTIKELKSLPPTPAVPSGINTQIIMQKAQKIISFQTIKQMPLTQMGEAISALEKFSIKQFDYNPTKKEIRFTLSGVSRATLFDLKNNLEQTGKFNQIAIPLSAFGSEEKESVTLTLQIK